MSDQSVWAKLFAEHASVEAFNSVIVPCMKTEGDAFKQAAAAEAKRRRYHASKELVCYVEMKVTKGCNLLLVGWSGGCLFATFTSGPRVYVYPDVPQEEFFKLCRSPFPDRLFNTNIKAKHKPKEAT